LDIYTDVIVRGPGADILTIDGGDSETVFSIHGGSPYAALEVKIEGLSITGSTRDGIVTTGASLALSHVNIHSNGDPVGTPSGYGRGIVAYGGSVLIENSAVHGHDQTGIATYSDLQMINTTVSGNGGAGIDAAVGPQQIELVGSTVANN
ncbi:unnamed protein product, partial [Ectocarpus sp. 4 AP-2014]